jgi:hypothetical protein
MMGVDETFPIIEGVDVQRNQTEILFKQRREYLWRRAGTVRDSMILVGCSLPHRW